MSVDNYDMMVCPYVGAHRVTAKRFVRHMLKCRRNHKDAEVSVCPYNARHVIPVPEFRYHLQYCVDRRLIEEEQKKQYYSLRETSSELKGETAIPPPMRHGCDFGQDENWDEEMKQESTTKKLYAISRRLRRPYNGPGVQRAVFPSNAEQTCIKGADSY